MSDIERSVPTESDDDRPPIEPLNLPIDPFALMLAAQELIEASTDRPDYQRGVTDLVRSVFAGGEDASHEEVLDLIARLP